MSIRPETFICDNCNENLGSNKVYRIVEIRYYGDLEQHFCGERCLFEFLEDKKDHRGLTNSEEDYEY